MDLNEGWYILYIGDSGYALRPWLLIPFQNPANDNEELYNTKQMRARSLIERCNGLLKMRFRYLYNNLFYMPAYIIHYLYYII